jgi:hypothetical protein
MRQRLVANGGLAAACSVPSGVRYPELETGRSPLETARGTLLNGLIPWHAPFQYRTRCGFGDPFRSHLGSRLKYQRSL